MQALRKYEHAASANGAPTMRRKDGSPLSRELGPTQEIEGARGSRLFDLKLSTPRYICVGFAVIRV